MIPTQSIAIIGASEDRSKYGNKAVRAYSSKGWVVYPVNPKHESIEGIKCYHSVTDLPEAPDFASLYLPPKVGVKVLKQIAEKGIRKVYVNPGAESDELVKEAERLGLEPLLVCSILSVGTDPEEL